MGSGLDDWTRLALCPLQRLAEGNQFDSHTRWMIRWMGGMEDEGRIGREREVKWRK